MIGALPLSKHGVIQLSKHYVKGGPQQGKITGKWQQVFVFGNDIEGGHNFDIGDYDYPDFPSGMRWVSHVENLMFGYAPGSAYSLDYSGTDPSGSNPDGSWKTSGGDWEMFDFAWAVGPMVGANPNPSGPSRNKIQLTGPVKGTLILYSDWFTGTSSATPTPRGCPASLDDSFFLYPPYRDPYLQRLPPLEPLHAPAVLSMTYKELALGEQLEIITDHIASDTDIRALMAFRYGVHPFCCITNIAPSTLAAGDYSTLTITGFKLESGFTLTIGGVDVTSGTRLISSTELFMESWNANTLPGHFVYDVVYTPPNPANSTPACTITGGFEITL